MNNENPEEPKRLDPTAADDTAHELAGLDKTNAAKFGTFADLGLHPDVLKALGEMGFDAPMEVQARTYPVVRKGTDVLVQSRTGSGKTAAFGIPLVDRVVQPEDKFVQAIILLPTRELALQVASELARISAHRPSTVVPVYGGAPMARQIAQLEAGGQIVCGTPGRILDHIRRGTLVLDKVRCAVLDECDEMLSMGFQEDIEAILEHTPNTRQTLLFSATLPEGIKRLSRRFLSNPEHLKLSRDFVGVQEIQHIYYSVQSSRREGELLRVLDFESPQRSIVFCNTREETGRVAEFLRNNKRSAEAISSDLSQSDREKVMNRMRSGDIQFLVATDVAARGIDLDGISHVFNYSFPDSPEVYIHRTGRTGRAGRHGIAVSLIGPTEIGAFYYLKLLYKIKPEERALPSPVQIQSRREGAHIQTLRDRFGQAPKPAWRSLAKRIISAADGEKLIAALLEAQLSRPAPKKSQPGAAPKAQAETPTDAKPSRDDRTPSRGAPRTANRDRRRTRGARDSSCIQDAQTASRDESVRPKSELTSSGATEPVDYDAVWATGDASGDEATASRERPSAAKASPESDADRGDGADESTAQSKPRERGTRRPGPRSRTDRRGADNDGGARLYINLGTKDKVTADDLATMVGRLGVTVALHDIDVMRHHSYMNVSPDTVEKVVAGLNDSEREGRRVICEQARPRR